MLIDKWQYPGIRRLSIKWSSHSSNLTQPVKAQWTNSTYMLYRAEIRRDGDAKQSYMITDHWPWQSHLRAVVAVHCYQAKLNRSLLRTSPEELRLVSVQFESVCCHWCFAKRCFGSLICLNKLCVIISRRSSKRSRPLLRNNSVY